MSDKKGLSAFLKKNQKKAKKTTNEAPVEETQAKDAEVIATQEKDKPTQQTKNEAGSSDEEEDELAQGLSYGNIKERKEIVSAKAGEESATAGYGFESSTATKATAGADASKAAKQKKTASDITFGGARPTFSKGLNKGKFGGEFSEGLDDLDADGNAKKKTQNRVGESSGSAAAGGAREFINLGGGTRARDALEENKEPAKPTGVKPTFKGRMNLTKTGGNQKDESSGVVTSYGFSVALRGPRTEDEKKEGEEGRARRDNRKTGDRGTPFHQFSKQEDSNDDEF